MIYLYWYLGISDGSMLLWILYYKFVEEKREQSKRGVASTFGLLELVAEHGTEPESVI